MYITKISCNGGLDVTIYISERKATFDGLGTSKKFAYCENASVKFLLRSFWPCMIGNALTGYHYLETK